ncbi:hypothetical protein CNMCM5623_006755 [Aspergillus felis]|uniref:Ketoreductase domain-containing protein n=1 Tax=Aspergillus felis TaxID=1287682 RepID=A0A8H6QLU5_9EURO|nr:hypothetical protein CNMCM5623_006755 [Aspergillus felis]
MPSGDPASLGCTPVRAVSSFLPDHSYLLVGGLGGIGRLVSSWMAQHGARSLVYLSRRAGELPEHCAFIRELEAQECEVTCVKGTVTNLADVEKAVSSCPRPLAEIIQMAGILRDRTLLQMTYMDWSMALAPKVTGTRHLHQMSKGLALDFFVMFGSISGTVGVGGQANYAAANYIPRRVRQIPAGEDRGQCSSSVGIGHVESPGAPAKYLWGLDARFGLHKDRQLGTSSTGNQQGDAAH